LKGVVSALDLNFDIKFEGGCNRVKIRLSTERLTLGHNFEIEVAAYKADFYLKLLKKLISHYTEKTLIIHYQDESYNAV
jgi:hypothetical protein